MQIDFAKQAYTARTKNWSAQRLVNYYAEITPATKDTKTAIVLHNTPGISSFATGLAGYVRGAEVMGGILYVVAGDTFYSLASDGTATTIGTIGTALGSVSMAKNRASPQQLCFVDGTDGWIYDTTNGLQQIMDANFLPADTVTFIDGYFVFNYAGTSQFFISNLDDGLTYTSTDIADAESDPDAVVAVWSNLQQLFVFNDHTTEIWYNSGNNDFPFERIAGGTLERGLGAAFSIAADDNTVFFVGDDRIIYRIAGTTPVRISQHAIEQQIEGYSQIADAYGFIVTIAGHKFYHLTFPDGGATFVYDIASGLWHERESKGQSYWRGRGYVRAYNKHLIGDAFQGRMGVLDPDVNTEFDGVIQCIAIAPPVHRDRKRIRHNRLEIDFEGGVGDLTETDPQMWVDWSDDGGKTWSAQKPKLSMGAGGDYDIRGYINRLGMARSRFYRVTSADAVKRSIMAAHLNGREMRN